MDRHRAKYQVVLVESVKRSLIFEAKTEKELKEFIEGRDYSTRILIDRYKYHSHSKTPHFDKILNYHELSEKEFEIERSADSALQRDREEVRKGKRQLELELLLRHGGLQDLEEELEKLQESKKGA